MTVNMPVLTPETARKYIDENTIGIVVMFGYASHAWSLVQNHSKTVDCELTCCMAQVHIQRSVRGCRGCGCHAQCALLLCLHPVLTAGGITWSSAPHCQESCHEDCAAGSLCRLQTAVVSTCAAYLPNRFTLWAAGELNKEKGWHVGIHVDAASGGFLAPFIYPDLKWDFRLTNVKSINTSGHK